MTQIIFYHRIFVGCAVATVVFFIMTFFLYRKLKIRGIVEFLRRNGKLQVEKRKTFRMEREIMLIHTNEIIE